MIQQSNSVEAQTACGLIVPKGADGSQTRRLITSISNKSVDSTVTAIETTATIFHHIYLNAFIERECRNLYNLAKETGMYAITTKKIINRIMDNLLRLRYATAHNTIIGNGNILNPDNLMKKFHDAYVSQYLSATDRLQVAAMSSTTAEWQAYDDAITTLHAAIAKAGGDKWHPTEGQSCIFRQMLLLSFLAKMCQQITNETISACSARKMKSQALKTSSFPFMHIHNSLSIEVENYINANAPKGLKSSDLPEYNAAYKAMHTFAVRIYHNGASQSSAQLYVERRSYITYWLASTIHWYMNHDMKPDVQLTSEIGHLFPRNQQYRLTRYVTDMSTIYKDKSPDIEDIWDDIRDTHHPFVDYLCRRYSIFVHENLPEL